MIDENYENNETEYMEDEVSESETTTITVQDLQVYNVNYATGTLFIVECLGLIFGALLASVFKDIFKM